MRTSVFSLACLLLILFNGSALAQEAGSVEFDRQVYIQKEIERQSARLNSSSEEERLDAVLKLGWIKTPESSRAATTALKDSSGTIRAAAANAILSLPLDEAANFLLPLLKDKTEIVREEAAYALGKTQNQSAVSTLLQVLNNKKKLPSVRGASIVALGMIGDSSVIPTLIQVLQEKKNANAFVQASAAHSLGQLRASEALPLLISIVSDEKADPEVRRESVWALGTIRDVSALGALSKAMLSSDPYLAEMARRAFNVIKLER